MKKVKIISLIVILISLVLLSGLHEVIGLDVGVVEIIGKPQVTCPANQKGLAGNPKTLSFTVTNTDPSSYGAFGLSLSCDKPIYGGVSLININLGPNQNTQVSGNVNGDILIRQDTTRTCKFKAYAIKNPDIYDECSFEYTAEFKKCTIGKKRCSTDGKGIETCFSDGNIDTSICYNGCEPFGDSARCKGTCGNKVCEPNLGEDQQNCREDCGSQQNFNGLFFIISIIIVITILIIIFKKRKVTKNK